MPIRSSSGVSSSKVQSFLAGAAAQQQALLASQQDADWQAGQTTDDDYLTQLRTRKAAASSALQAQNITNNISTLQVSMQRKSIQNDIDNGKKTYVDLYQFEKGLLDGMQPGSTAYDDQQTRVQNTTSQVISLARQTLQQQVQNRQATPVDLAAFEKVSLNAFDQGTPAYQQQLYQVQDSQRKADQWTYQKSTALQDAQMQMKIQEAKNAKNVPLVSQLSQQYAQSLADRYQTNPEQFTDINGSPTADFYALQTKINSTVQGASDFATNIASAAAAAGKSAFTKEMSDQSKNYNNLIAVADNKIKQITSGQGTNADGTPMSAQQSASALQALYQNKIEASTAYADALSQIQSTAPDAASALQLQTDLTNVGTSVISFKTQRDNFAKLTTGSNGVVNTYDPSSGQFTPQSVNQFDANGKVDISSIVGNDNRGGWVQGPNGQTYAMRGSDQVVSVKNSDGSVDQYFVDPSGVVEYRKLSATPAGSTGTIDPNNPYKQQSIDTQFKPLGNSDQTVAQNLIEAEQTHPGLAKELGLPDEVQQQVTQQAGAPLSVQDKPTSETNLDGTPVVKDLKVQTSPSDNSASVGTTLKVSDANVQAAKANEAAHTAELHVTDVNQANEQLKNNLTTLTSQKASADQLAANLQAQVKAGNSALSKQLLDATTKASALQDTISGLQLQGSALMKYVQGAATVGDLAKVGINLTAPSTGAGSGQSVQPAATNPIQGSGSPSLQGGNNTVGTINVK